MIIGNYTVIPSIYVTDRYKINYNLLQRLLKKHPEKSESAFKCGIVYILPREEKILCSPETYSKLQKGELNGISSNYFINN